MHISELANHALDDGDDLIITDSFRPREDAASTVGVSSLASHVQYESRLSGFSELSSRTSFSEYANEKAPFWRRLPLPIKPPKNFWPWRKGTTISSSSSSHPEVEPESFPVEFNDAHHYIQRPVRRTGSGDVGSVMSIRSHRLNVADGRNLLVRQKAQVVGRNSAAEAHWEVASRTSGETGGDGNSIRRFMSVLSLDDGASVVSHLTEADFLSRTNQHSSRMMFFAPQTSLLGSIDGDDEYDDSPTSEGSSPLQTMYSYDAPSLMSRPSTAYREAGFIMEEVAEDDEDDDDDYSLWSEDDNFIASELNNGITTSTENVTVRNKSWSQRKNRIRTSLSDPDLMSTAAEWRPPSPLEGSGHVRRSLQHQRQLPRTSSDSDAIQVLAQLLENHSDRIFPDMEYEGGAAPRSSDRNIAAVPSATLITTRPKTMTRSRRATSGPDTGPVDQPLRPRIFTGSPKNSPPSNCTPSPEQSGRGPSLWERRMMAARGSETDTDENRDGIIVKEELSKVLTPNDDNKRAEVLVASWHRWLSDPEIDVLADVPLPGNIQSGRPARKTEDDQQQQHQQQQQKSKRPRVKSESDVPLFSDEGDSKSTASPSPRRLASRGLESGASRPRAWNDGGSGNNRGATTDSNTACLSRPIVACQRPGTNHYQVHSAVQAQPPSRQTPQIRSRKLSDSELSTSSGRPLPRPSSQSRNRTNSLEYQRQRIFSDSELTISSEITELTRPSSHWNVSNGLASSTHHYNGNNSSSDLQHRTRGRIFSDSEITTSSWASSLHGDIPTTDNEGNIQFTDLSSPSALGAAKQLASSIGNSDVGFGGLDTVPPPVATRNLYAATVSNSRCREYYWNEGAGTDRLTPIASPSGAEVLWSDSTDSYADVF